jgi:hypothetical protein
MIPCSMPLWLGEIGLLLAKERSIIVCASTGTYVLLFDAGHERRLRAGGTTRDETREPPHHSSQRLLIALFRLLL